MKPNNLGSVERKTTRLPVLRRVPLQHGHEKEVLKSVFLSVTAQAPRRDVTPNHPL